MRIFKISHGTEFFSDAVFAELRQRSLVSVHPDTKAKGQAKQTQGELFFSAEFGDIFYLCRSNQSVELVGMFTDQRPLYSTVADHGDWVERSYALLYDATDSQAYDQELDKWWSPKNNSTCTEIPENEWPLFETAILRPVFSISMVELREKQLESEQSYNIGIEDCARLQMEFADLMYDQSKLYERVNGLDELELRKIHYSYLLREEAYIGPVVLLRRALLEKRMAEETINADLIEARKEEIKQSYDKDIFRAWKNPFRVLYSLLYEQAKEKLITFFETLIRTIISDLELEGLVSYKLVHLDGPQNQGYDRIWFAIYNNTFPSQQQAKQLFFMIKNGFEYGLYDEKHKDRTELHKAIQFNYEHLLATFAKYKSDILMDDSKGTAYFSTVLQVLAHKKQIILQGPPGTGKTYAAKQVARQLVGRVNFEEHVRLVQFHPSYTYEDFVRGISAKSEGGEIIYETENKLLASFAEKARLNWEAAQKDEVDLSREERVKTLMREFADWVQDELDEKSSFKITEAVSIVQVETDAFRYTGEWNTSQRMKFKDLIQAELLGVSNRQELIKAEGLSGLAKQHASYFIKVLEQFRRRYADILRQSVDVNVESPEVLPFVIIIDEINRANLPSVLGELIYALEYRNEPVESLYALDGDNTIVIPENLYIIGTMNTADRRVGHIDYAIKRRFAFLEVLPREAVIYHEQAKELFRRVSKLFVTEEHGKLVSSEFLAPDFSYRDVQLGHSYFMLQEGPANEQTEELKLRWNYEILPLLREYVKDGLLLETALEEIENIASFVD